MNEERLVNKAFEELSDMHLVLKAAIQALKLDELAGYVTLERPGYVV